jgi:LacI family transcriptional regulator
MTKPPRRAHPKKPSMYDVARAAGVSQTTVSFVVNNARNTNISQETCDRVRAAIQELGWRPNEVARGLTLRRSHIIGFVSDEIATSPYAGKMIQGAQDTALANNKMLMVVNTESDPAVEASAIEMLLEQQVEAFIYATMYHRAVSLPAALSHAPVVLLDCYSPDRSLPSVVPNETQGGRTATETLLARGHQRIGFINNVDPIPATFGRLQGYKQALAAAGVEYDGRLVRAGKSSAAEGHRCALELLALPEPPTALFCFSDVIAMGAYDALRKRGLSIPDDVAVIGFDNFELIAAQLYPPLTTMELPHYQMAQWAVRRLLDQIDSAGELAPVHHTVACPLITRESA